MSMIAPGEGVRMGEETPPPLTAPWCSWEADVTLAILLGHLSPIHRSSSRRPDQQLVLWIIFQSFTILSNSIIHELRSFAYVDTRV